MTPIVSEEMREKAREIIDSMDTVWCDGDMVKFQEQKAMIAKDLELIAQALQEAHDKGVEEERDECAKVAESADNDLWPCHEPENCLCPREVAKAIRNRGKQEETR